MNAHTISATAAASVAEVDGYSIVGPNSTVEVPAVTADRMARLADELAALVNGVCAALAWQDEALANAAPDATARGRDHLTAARHVAQRAARSLHLVMDSLGEVHVTCDQLAHDLHRRNPMSR